MERQLIHSLLGQSEVLTSCGTFLLVTGQTYAGVGMIGLGVISAFTRFCVNAGFLNKQFDIEEPNNDDKIKELLEKLSSNKA
tara:strand:+ start:203 stop:448 length:246 start_codon:yes stop_codon:yes gene_type:complete